MFVNPEDLNVNFFLPIFTCVYWRTKLMKKLDRNLTETIDGREFFAREP